MTTGVDAQTCKLIVLDKSVNSMIEFKQIIGRGTRINEDFDKFWFTIMDFRKATELFADPAFDGEPVQIYNPGPDDPPVPPDEPGGEEPEGEGPVIVDPIPLEPAPGQEPCTPRIKYYVNDVPVYVVNERVQYHGPDGKLVTESLKDYTKKSILRDFASLDDFLRTWKHAEKKQALIEELREKGIFFEALADEVGRDLDPFDLICHVAFGQKPLTRQERANNVRKRDYFIKYGDTARAVLDALLEKYADEGIQNLERMDVLKVTPFDRFGSPIEIVRSFGGKEHYVVAVMEMEDSLYSEASND
jgi:type I restriction enzyme R subunit